MSERKSEPLGGTESRLSRHCPGADRVGMACGLLMAANGYGPLWSTLMSAIGFGGSKYKGLGKIRPLLIYVLSDETFSFGNL